MTPNPQPCIICGGSVTRLWSFQSHVGDHYLRIYDTNNANNSNITDEMGVDFGGLVDGTNTSVDTLVQFKDVSSGFPDFETRMILVLYHNNVKYHLKARDVDEELIAVTEDVAANLTDKSDVFAPVKLSFEHHLFYVFESVLYRDHYLASTGEAKTKLVNVHSEPFRDSETLIKIIDPGQAIAGAAFGENSNSGRRKRALVRRRSMRKEIVELFPGRAYGKKKVAPPRVTTEGSRGVHAQS
ncbi:uncharacterized protein LOC114533427 [Dendronephthya gigantea]|uniref:uncharacterized protein LOC114533427 n=1 Tax=Dendronephthya gigantea TaxID=151771 RepID=UPI00106BC22D|nr:uncharacterized protein LOC114533427 [Dendronephthya gigantea]